MVSVSVKRRTVWLAVWPPGWLLVHLLVQPLRVLAVAAVGESVHEARY